MFDVSLGEAAMVGLVAMLVIGPKRLPAVAKTVGLVVGRVQRFMAGIKNELQATSESSGLAELQRELHNASIMARAQVEESWRQHQADGLNAIQAEKSLENSVSAPSIQRRPTENAANLEPTSPHSLKKEVQKQQRGKKRRPERR
ncbi:MAG: twin-arginine translocase TatA/TatE family subunit [Neisseriaceae bacterium]|nr:twin-arginine translocase TatA/TatE family subunit [Neisseriaceae bacterium]